MDTKIDEKDTKSDTNISGFYYIENYLTKEENTKLLNLLQESDEWEHIGGSDKARRVIQYGYTYSYDRTGVTKLDENIPKIFSKLVKPNRVNNAIGTDLIKSEFEQLIINEYIAGQGIAAHTDHIKYFGSIIICISLGSDIDINFTRISDKKSITVRVKKRSLYVMSGDARYKWMHEIIKRKKDGGDKRSLRYSLTYRTIMDSYKEKDKK